MKKTSFCALLTAVLLLFAACNTNEAAETDTTENDTLGYTDENMSYNDNTTLSEEASSGDSDINTGNKVSQMSFYGKNTGTDKTETGYEPLPEADFIIDKSDGYEKLSSEMISHSYGVAKDEKPHTISVNYQKLFDEKGFDAVCYDHVTEEKVLYLTFDCGYENGYTSKILDTLKEKNVQAAFFCTLPQMQDNHELIARMITEGHIVGNHSVNHPDFSALSADETIEELKGFDDYIRKNFGYSSLYFRYPQGKYSEKALKTVNDLGYKCIFWSLAYADWETDNQKGPLYAYETVMSRLHPGAVILLHSVSSDNAGALSDIIDSARERGYEFRSLEDL